MRSASTRTPFHSARLILIACAALAVGTAHRMRADEPAEEKQEYVRVLHDDKHTPIAMQTAIVSYGDAEGKREDLLVELVGAVHVGDKAYYDELNKLFESYDALLYELVAPEGTTIPKGGREDSGGHPLGAMQLGMTRLLDLQFQLNCIDYTKENFIHADMSPEEFAQSMKDRGESFLQMFMRMMGQAMAQQAASPSGTSDAELLAALFSRDRPLRLKRILSGELANMEGALTAIEGPEGSTIISERNKKALEVLKREIEAGKKRIGVFYGAGHLEDMDKRLQSEFGLAPKEVRWVTAWSMKSGTTTKNRAPDDGANEAGGAKEADGAKGGDADAPPKETPNSGASPNDDPVPLSDPFAEPEHEGAELEPVP